MSNPQQPELRRSEHGATVERSAKEHADDHLGAPPDELPEHLVPEDNRPGAHRDTPQDQPDLDAFAERLGLRHHDETDDETDDDADD